MKKVYWIVLGIAMAMLSIATFADLHFANTLLNRESAFGHFFAVVAMAPTWTLIPISAGLMFGALIAQFKDMGKIWRVICSCLLVFGVYMAIQRTTGFYGSRHLHGLPFPYLIYIVITAFLLATVLGAYASKKYPREVIIAALVGIIAVAGGRMLLDLFKDVWGRQRFWTMTDMATQFTAWYAPQFPNAARVKELGDTIKSFPSGHSFGSMSVLWLSMFPAFIEFCQEKRKAWSNGIAIFALCFWAPVMLSRMVLGEHFLSDVSMSAIIFLVAFIFANWIIDKIYPNTPARS
ncbi:MAG: phosphatase PAP2 family protein [Fibromonadales bacterium]|nr:phosphatase PAP2 family protein [Fibromonadales bacterium]